MTLRAFLIGLAGAVFLCGHAFYNDIVIRQTNMVGTHFPQSVYGTLLLLLLIINPLLKGLSRVTRAKWLRPLSGREYCLIMALVLPACCMATASWMRLLPRAMMMPHHYAMTIPSWKYKPEGSKTYQPITQLLPKFMMADPDMDDSLTTFVQGRRKDVNKPLRFMDVPWAAWTKPLAYWLPLFGFMWIALTGVALVFHRQWATNEHLPYPVVQVAQAMLPGPDNRIPMFHNRMFWIGLVAIFLLHLNNYLQLYYPDYIIPVVRTLDFRGWRNTFPIFVKGGGYGTLMWIRLYFTVIGLAYMLPSDVCLSVGFSPFVFFTIFGYFIEFGLPLRTGPLFSPRPDWGMVFGAYIGFFAVLMYTGRHYTFQALRGAFGRKVSKEIDRESIWGMRVFIIAIIAFIIGVTAGGLDWWLALLLALMMVIAYLVMARILVETGMYHLNPNLYPGIIVVALMGDQALGPTTLAIIFFTTTMFFMDTRENYMPFIMSALKFLDGTRETPSDLHHHTSTELPLAKPKSHRWKYFPMLAVIMVLGCFASISMGWYYSYDRGINWLDVFGVKNVPQNTFNSVVKSRQVLEAQGMLKTSESVKGFARMALINPAKPFWVAFAITFGGVLLLSTLRLRYAKWPIHPIIFCAWSGFAGYVLAWSFVIGGIIKVLIMKFGGAKTYQACKPLFIGLIAGDLLAGIMVIISGSLYFFITGEPPKNYYVLPG